MSGPYGPFWMQKPTAATGTETWAYAYLYLSRYGRICCVEWLS